MNPDKVELLKEVIKFMKRFKDKDEAIKTLELLIQDDPDIAPILNRIRAEKGDVVYDVN